MHLLIFYFFGGTAIFAAVGMVVSRQPAMSALFLILNMFCLAGLYAQLDAHLIAALQVLIYAGAIMVLVMFVIMLLNLREKRGVIARHQVVSQVVGIGILAIVMTKVVSLVSVDKIIVVKKSTEDFGGVAAVAETLFTDYLLPFEIASVLLLAAIVGAVILAKSKV